MIINDIQHKKQYMNISTNTRNIIIVLLISVLCNGCRGHNQTPPKTDKVTVYVNAVQDTATRTYIGGENLDETLWSELDEISIYWHESGSADVLSGTKFGYCSSYRTETMFSATISPLESGYYTYYGCYPEPEEIEGTHVIYTLPEHQDGTYDMQHVDVREYDDTAAYRGNCDIMIAKPAEAGSLTEMTDNLQMEFVHQCHAIRISVPEARNLLGGDIARIRVEFPTDVVGRMKSDLTDPYGQPELIDGKSTVWLDLDKALAKDEDRYLWMFVAPATMDGAIKFTAYDINGYQSESISVNLTREFKSGRITPINLTIPDELPVKWIDMSIDGNHLGEDVRQLTITAPEGAVFRNGRNTCTFDIDETNLYSVGYYQLIDGTDNEALMTNGTFTVTYESDNALINETHTLTNLSELHTQLKLTVPYLFYEDFSGVPKSGDENKRSSKAMELSEYNLAGWTGHNVGFEAGKSVRLAAYLGSSALDDPDKGDNWRGRLDSPQLSNLKDGAAVKIEISYDVSGTSVKGTKVFGQAVCYAQYQFGIDTKTGTVSYKDTIETPAFGSDQQPDMNGNYNTISTHVVTELSAVTNTHRLAWRSSFNVEHDGLSTITAQTIYIYLDNIKVSIKK